MLKNEKIFIRKIGKQYLLIIELKNSDINFIHIASPADAELYAERMKADRRNMLYDELEGSDRINKFEYILDESCKNISLADGIFKSINSDDYFIVEMYLLNLDMTDEFTHSHKNDAYSNSFDLRHAVVFLCYPEGNENILDGWEMVDIRYISSIEALPIKSNPFGYFINNIPSDFGIDINEEK